MFFIKMQSLVSSFILLLLKNKARSRRTQPITATEPTQPNPTYGWIKPMYHIGERRKLLLGAISYYAYAAAV